MGEESARDLQSRSGEPGSREADPRGGWYRLPRSERCVLGALVAGAAAAFLPALRGVDVAGVALFGWLMAALMLLSPLLALWVFWRDRPRS